MEHVRQSIQLGNLPLEFTTKFGFECKNSPIWHHDQLANNSLSDAIDLVDNDKYGKLLEVRVKASWRLSEVITGYCGVVRKV